MRDSQPKGEASEDPSDARDFTSRVLDRLSHRGESSSRYRLDGEIGSGGMGTILRVWDEDLRRHLAMKVVRGEGESTSPGHSADTSRRLLGRFLEEAQVTGQLDHPGIVPVHELGLDVNGRVYFTMKLVQGRDLAAIFDLVRERKDGWDPIKALGVLRKVCDAMSYAHHKGVIHRDLKPANVMVGSYGEVYVMDWGIAKTFGRPEDADARAQNPAGGSAISTDRKDDADDSTGSAMYTMHGDVVGTPAYMSPEQANGDHAAMGPRSDVYAMGAMLYHLLVGHTPYSPRAAEVSNVEIWRRVREGPPPPLDREAPTAPVELVAISERAMARDLDARYPSMTELGADLAAFLENRVVAAYETGTWAETKKWLNRNKALASSLAAAVLLLVAGLSASLLFKARADRRANELAEANVTIEKRGAELARALRAAEESAELADARRADAEFLAQFQSRLLSELRPDEFGRAIVLEQANDLAANLERMGRDPAEIDRARATLMEILRPGNPTNVAQRVLASSIFEPAVRTIETEYAQKPLLAAMLQTPLAATLEELSLFELGERAARAAVTSRRAGLGEDHPDTLTAIDHLARLLQAEGRLAEAEPLFREAVAGSRAVLGDGHASTLVAINHLAGLLEAQGKLAEAETLFVDVLQRRRATLGDQHTDTLSVAGDLASVLRLQGRLSESEALQREALAGNRAVFGDEHPETITAINNLAALLLAQGSFPEAESLSRQVLAARRDRLGDDHAKTLSAMNNLAAMLQVQGKYDEAEPLQREALARLRATLGDTHPQTLTLINNYATLLQEAGRLADAEVLYREALAGRRPKLGDAHPETLRTMSDLAVLLHTQGKLAEAESLCRETLAGRRAALGDDHPDTLSSIVSLANQLIASGRSAESEPLSREAFARTRATLGDRHPSTLSAQNGLAFVLRFQGKLSEAEPLAREALAVSRDVLGDLHPNTLATMNNFATILSDRRQLDEAEPLLREALASERAVLGREHPETLKTMNNLAALLFTKGDRAEVELLLREALDTERRVLGDLHYETLNTISNCGILTQAQGKAAEAEAFFREAFTARRKQLGDDHPLTVASRTGLVSALRAQGRLSDVVTIQQEVLERRMSALGPEHASTQAALREIIATYERWHEIDPLGGHGEKAADLRALLAN